VRADLPTTKGVMSSYPWGEAKPSQLLVNLADSVSVRGQQLLFRDRGTPQSPNFEAHDWAAAFGSNLSPYATKTGRDFRGPQDPAVVCSASGPSAPPQPKRCDDTEYGKGAGGQLAYKLRLKGGEVATVWFGVGGSTSGPAEARAELQKALDDPYAAIVASVRSRERVNALSDVSLPGNLLLARSVTWSKQMLAASEQQVEDVRLRVVNAGQAYRPPVGTLKSMRWLGAGRPDYSWLFGTDGEYAAFAAAAAGQFGPIKGHLRALRDVSQTVNEGSGKIVHEVTPDGALRPRPLATARPGAGPSGRRRRCSTSSKTTGGTTQMLVRGLAGRSGQREGVPAALDRANPNRRRVAEAARSRIGATGVG
jgi:hypothetical protein